MKKILVTGGAGFIGSNLCEAFLEEGHNVICLDNFSTGHIENVIDLTERFPNSFRLIIGDIRNLNDCKKAVDGMEYVVHQAALGSVPRSIDDPAATNDVNITGFMNMMLAAKEEGVNRFIFAASSSTYGDSTVLPKVEEHIGTPLSPYAVTKYVNELYAEVFARVYGIEYIGLRYFNVFGRRQDPNGPYAAVIPIFAKQMLSGKRPTINGDGEYSRDFTYIDNVVLMNKLALNTDNPDAVNQIYNTACGERTTLNQLFEYLRDSLSKYKPKLSKMKPIYGASRLGDIPHSLASIDKAQRLLGYQPCCSVKQGLENAATWYYENLKH